jgi:hypothetical protein
LTFTSTLTKVTSDGNRRIATGTFTAQSGDWIGTIKPVIKSVEAFDVSPTVVGSTAVVYWVHPVVITYPLSPGLASGIVVVLSSGLSGGVWKARGLG